MKISAARRNRATPPQNRRGICRMRTSLPSKGPRSNGSKGRYLLPNSIRSLDACQCPIVRAEVALRLVWRVVEVPPHRVAQACERVGRRPAEQTPRLARGGRDVLAHRARGLQVLRQQVVADADQLRVGACGVENR